MPTHKTKFAVGEKCFLKGHGVIWFTEVEEVRYVHDRSSYMYALKYFNNLADDETVLKLPEAIKLLTEFAEGKGDKENGISNKKER